MPYRWYVDTAPLREEKREVTKSPASKIGKPQKSFTEPHKKMQMGCKFLDLQQIN